MSYRFHEDGFRFPAFGSTPVIIRQGFLFSDRQSLVKYFLVGYRVRISRSMI